MESSGSIYVEEKSFQHQNNDRTKATTSTVSRIRRGTSHALAVGEAAGEVASVELEVGVAAFTAGSWSFPQPGCFPVTNLGAVLPLPLEPLPLLPVVFVVTGVDVTDVDGRLLASIVGLFVICQFADPSGMRAYVLSAGSAGVLTWSMAMPPKVSRR